MFQADLMEALLFSAVAFNNIDAPAFFHFLFKCVPGIQTLPSQRTLSGPVLQRLVAASVTNAKVFYKNGTFVTFIFDGWKSPAGRKLLGILCNGVGKVYGRVSCDVQGTVDITAVLETAALIKQEVSAEMARTIAGGDEFVLPLPSGGTPSGSTSMVGAMVSD